MSCRAKARTLTPWYHPAPRVRVVMVIPVLDPATGGPPAVVAALLAHLPAVGVDAVVVCYDGWPGDGSRGRVEQLLARVPAGTPSVRFLPPLNRLEVLTARTARLALPDLLHDAEVVHIHGVWDALCLAAAGVARRLGRPYVISTHGMLEPWAVERQGRLSRWKKQARFHLGWGAMLAGAAGFHDFRPGPLTVLGHRLEVPVEVIPNGITPAGVEASTLRRSDGAWDGLCRRYPSLARGRLVLSLGRLSVQKGTDTLAAAFDAVADRFPDVVLLLAGADYGLGRVLSRRYARRISAGRVLMPGVLLGEEKAAVLARASMFVLPSRHEGFSMAALEAMSAGLPCVLSEACHFPEAGRAGAALVVPPDDPAALAGALSELLEAKPERREAMGERGKHLVLERYTWPAIAPSYASWYGRAAGREPVPPAAVHG